LRKGLKDVLARGAPQRMHGSFINHQVSATAISTWKYAAQFESKERSVARRRAI
jgi:hypothetical protein